MNDVLLHLIACDLRYLVFETCICALIFISLFLECWYILFWRLSVWMNYELQLCSFQFSIKLQTLCPKHIAHLRQHCHNSKSVIFQEKLLKVLKCYNFLWVQQRHNCSPAASFAYCIMTLYLLKVHLKTFLSIPITQKCQILSCEFLVANERHYVLNYSKYITLIKLPITYTDVRMSFIALPPWSRVLHEKLTGTQLVMKFTPYYGIRRIITAITRPRHLSLSWATTIQSINPHPTSWRPNLILSPLLRLEDPDVGGQKIIKCLFTFDVGKTGAQITRTIK